MLIARRLAAMLGVMLLGGCGAADDASSRREPPPVEETVFGDMVGAMDRARGVEDTLQQQKQERDRQIADGEDPQTE
jgi:hypothetical protein